MSKSSLSRFITLFIFLGALVVHLGFAPVQVTSIKAQPRPTVTAQGGQGQGTPQGIEHPRRRRLARQEPTPSYQAVVPSLTSSIAAPSLGTNFQGIGEQPDSSNFIHKPPDT